MAASTERSPGPRHDRAELLELRRTSLSLAVAGTAITAGLVFLLADPRLAGDILRPGRVSLSLLATALAALALGRRSAALAATVLIVGLAASLALASAAFAADSILPWYALLVLLGTALLGRRGGVAIGVAVSAGLGFVPAASAGAADAVVHGTQVMVGAAVGLSWLVTHPLYTALSWSWQSYRQALVKTLELERHQGELARALKGVSDANYRLEVANLELSRARQAADEARRLKARFAAFVSHELRLPLNIITGFSEMMVMSPGSYDGQLLPSAYRADVEAIYRASYHLSSLIDDVLDLSEIEAHRMGLQKEWISLADVVAQASLATRGLLENKGLALEVDLQPGIEAIYADGTRIRQVVMNLLKNAARFTDRGGVRVSASSRDGAAVVAIADTGIGIAPEDVPRVFEEFGQLAAAGTRRWGGSGLGLTISKQFVEMHGGNMWVESVVGSGTTFFFSLPLCDNVAAATIRDEWETWVRVQAPAGEAARPVLVVLGGDEAAARLLQRHLEAYHVLAAADPDELDRLAEQAAVQAVVVVQRSDEEGQRLQQAARARLPSAAVVACTAPTSDEANVPGLAGWLVKPVDRERLARALRARSGVERVVLVDDDPEMVRLLVAMVRSIAPGCQVWSATDGQEALALVSAHRPQLLLLDLVMPNLDGREVLRRLRATPAVADTPVIMVTAGALAAEPARAEIRAITRGGGLTPTELVRCLQGALSALLSGPDTDRERPEVLAA